MRQETNLLAKAMGFPTELPTAPVTRSVRILFTDRIYIEPKQDKSRFIPKKHRVTQKKDGMTLSQKAILKIVNKGEPVTGYSAAKETSWTNNHCSMILTSLYKKGLVKRYKEKGNGTRWYVYKKLEGK